MRNWGKEWKTSLQRQVFGGRGRGETRGVFILFFCQDRFLQKHYFKGREERKTPEYCRRTKKDPVAEVFLLVQWKEIPFEINAQTNKNWQQWQTTSAAKNTNYLMSFSFNFPQDNHNNCQIRGGWSGGNCCVRHLFFLVLSFLFLFSLSYATRLG